MEVFLRRTKKMHSALVLEYTISNLRFSFTNLKIYVAQQEISLTQIEADLLKVFCQHPNKVLKREEVLLHVWGKDDNFLECSMDVFISRLRNHIKVHPSIMLETIHGIGFRLLGCIYYKATQVF